MKIKNCWIDQGGYYDKNVGDRKCLNRIFNSNKIIKIKQIYI